MYTAVGRRTGYMEFSVKLEVFHRADGGIQLESKEVDWSADAGDLRRTSHTLLGWNVSFDVWRRHNRLIDDG